MCTCVAVLASAQCCVSIRSLVSRRPDKARFNYEETLSLLGNYLALPPHSTPPPLARLSSFFFLIIRDGMLNLF